MDPERLERIELIYRAALELEPGARETFLDQASAGDVELRCEVASLLAHDEASVEFIESPVMEVSARELASESLSDAHTQPLANAPAPSQLGFYQILSPLGCGGMGEVYLAHDVRLGRKVAIKLLPARFTIDASRVRRFAQEARAASAINHPNIITIHEIGEAPVEDGGTHYIVTEYVEGETLRRRIADAPGQRLDVAEAVNIASQVAAALSAAHQAGITHRDIKPENVMVRRDGIVKVLDFGLAKLIEPSSPVAGEYSPTRAAVITETGLVMGTPHYMSPEQARGERVDARTDLFSLGVLLYEMVAGATPFTGASAADIIVAILEKEPAPLAGQVSDLPVGLEPIIGRCLAKPRENRYQSAEELMADLKDLARHISQPPPARSSSPSDSADNSDKPTSQLNWKARRTWLMIALLSLSVAASFLTYRTFAPAADRQIESIAVLPFKNESGNADVEYLSDGMTESLINSLSQLPELSVKARSTVFRYKGREAEPQTIAGELSVQAILNGRMVQRGDDLTLYLALVDGRNGDHLWGDRYDRKMADLVMLQNEITRDVSRKLRARLSGEDEQRLAKKHPANAQAYQLYLKGRHHVLELTRPEIQRGISYFQQAIAIDPSYALAYVGMADAYRALTLSVDLPSNEILPKSREAAQRAVDNDDASAEAHAILGYVMYLHDWNWDGAENQFKRALELDPNSGDAHFTYAHFLSNMGRHAEALNEAKRARELEPLNLRTNALEGQFLLHAGRIDEALERLQKTFELDANFWMAHQIAASVYIEKGMFAEAIAEARRAKAYSGDNSIPIALSAYALAKADKRGEARAELRGLLKRSTERYVSPYNIALIYNSLGERDEALAWLERAFAQRHVRMTFLKVEPKWNNLRSDPRFQDLLRRVGFKP